MKRFLSLLLTAALLLGLLSACQQSGPVSTPALPAADLTAASLEDLIDAAFNASGYASEEGPEVHSAQDDRAWMEAYIENAYGLTQPWEDAAVLRGVGASAFEVAVLLMENEDAAAQAASGLTAYLDSRQGDFAGYAPAEADMAAQGVVTRLGSYAALLICPAPDSARQALEVVFQGEDAPLVSGAVTGVRELRNLLAADRGMTGPGVELLDGSAPEALADYIQTAYGLTPDQWDQCAIAREEDTAREIAVFLLDGASGAGDSELQPNEDGEYEVAVGGTDADWERINSLSQALDSYLNVREAQFDSGTEQAKLLHQAITISSERYVVMLACPDAEDAAWVFAEASGSMGYGCSPRYRYLDTDEAFPDRCTFTAPNEDDMSLYDTTAILDAWEKGDPSGLSDYDRKIYDAAAKVLKKEIKSGMSDYEKEVAVYGWIVKNVDYDWTHQDRARETPRESFTPYGGLVNHTAVCLGYATTFQLLMDLCGVECITVPGASRDSREDHGWNQVRLNGQWYCVDVTWDANHRELGGRGRQQDWWYFNVTSDFMAATDHQWDYANTPEATAGDQGKG